MELLPYTQKIDILPFNIGCLAEHLGLKPPSFSPPELAFRQLKYLENYVSHPRLGRVCHSLLIERHYIDRDHIADHSVFYSRNLYPYPNHCQRVHFFSCLPQDLTTFLAEARNEGIINPPLEAYHLRCQNFSKEHYLGFSVIKPLSGCPVGRTVLQCYPEKCDDGSNRVFSCTSPYTAHVAGVELTVVGLPFQQQDVAVAAWYPSGSAA
jgi:hypothetical protein